MFFKNKLVLVTGGTGFVGMHIVEELLKRGARVRVPVHTRPLAIRDERIETIRADLTRQEDCLAAFKGVDCAFHAAGATVGAAVTIAGPMDAITTNMVLTMRVLQAAWIENVERILIYSSSTVYPPADYPIREEEMWSAPPSSVYLGYGWSRRFFEIMGEYLASKTSVKVAILRPTAVYGRRDNFDPIAGHVIPALIRRAVARENPFVVWGTGAEVRDFLHVRDLARGSILLLEKHPECDPVNIGCGKGATIREVVEIILRAAGHSNANVVFDFTKPTTIPFRMVDTSKAHRCLGFSPSLSLTEGIEDTVRWYIETLGKN